MCSRAPKPLAGLSDASAPSCYSLFEIPVAKSYSTVNIRIRGQAFSEAFPDPQDFIILSSVFNQLPVYF